MLPYLHPLSAYGLALAAYRIHAWLSRSWTMLALLAGRPAFYSEPYLYCLEVSDRTLDNSSGLYPAFFEEPLDSNSPFLPLPPSWR